MHLRPCAGEALKAQDWARPRNAIRPSGSIRGNSYVTLVVLAIAYLSALRPAVARRGSRLSRPPRRRQLYHRPSFAAGRALRHCDTPRLFNMRGCLFVCLCARIISIYRITDSDIPWRRGFEQPLIIVTCKIVNIVSYTYYCTEGGTGS